jgi:hypothetical protein
MSKTESKGPETPVIITKAYDLTLWLERKIAQFPRNHRYTVTIRRTAC